MKKDKKKGKYEPLVSLRRPVSAEKAQVFSVFRSNGGKREASARASHERVSYKKKYVFTICFGMKKDKKEETMNPLFH